MKPKHRWYAVAVFFAFMFVHQADRLMIGPLTTPIMETFDINEAQMGAVSTAALIVSAVLYPVWGYLYDRYARSKLLALAKRSYRYPHTGYRMPPTSTAPVKTAPICASSMPKVSMIGVVSGPISKRSDWWSSINTKKIPTTTQR